MAENTQHNDGSQNTPGASDSPAPAQEAPRRHGLAGWMASAFIESPLTPLLLIASFLVGLLGMLVTPREEDPQISVPMVDIIVAYPGASAEQVKNLVSEPLERLMSELSGVKHVYSRSEDGMSLVIVRFHVGEQMEPSLVKLYDKLQSHMDAIPKGVMPPLVKPKSIDDVPVVTVTLSSGTHDIVTLRKLALDVLQRFKSLPDTGQSFIVGGSQEQVRVEVDPARVAGYGLTLAQIARVIGSANQRAQAGNVVDGSRAFTLFSGEFLHDARQVGDLVVSVHQGQPVFLRDVATISQGESETKTVVTHTQRVAEDSFTTHPAVTIAVAKKKGTNGVDVARSLLSELGMMQGTLIPQDVQVSVTRDYGATAHEKVSGLIFKLFLVSVLVTVLMFITMGKRPAVIVLITIPVVLLMSLAVAYLFKFTINRVSMFALVFAIGILVDDAIVVVENIYRRWLSERRTDDDLTVDAVDEVGNPTILATFTVVAALLPMGFVSDMMGPYMLPIPVLSSAAMLFSLLAAFVFVPWLAARMKPKMRELEIATEREHRQGKAIAGFYDKMITPIMDSTVLGFITLMVIIGAMLAAMSMFYFKAVPFKMLPYDNKSELQVVIDMPEGTDLFVTTNLAQRLGQELQSIPEVTAFQTYVGTASPFNFNGLVRHYFMRMRPWQSDLSVQLLDKKLRKRSSHDIATEVRERLTPIAYSMGARLTIAETPPGPPVLAPVVVELYGPTAEIRRKVASDVMAILYKTPNIADINTMMEVPHDEIVFEVDRLRASMFGLSVEEINREVMMAMGGFEVGPVKLVHELEQTIIVLQVPLAMRANLGNLLVLPIRLQNGASVPLGELGRFVKRSVSPPIYHKDLRPLEYVMADVVGKLGAPLYGMLDVDTRLQGYTTPDGQVMGGHYFGKPSDTSVSGFKWDGEWEVTYVTFRDMGLAFMAALVLIYILVVAEFKNFILPLVVMAPIPLTLIGIVPGHWLLNADFTATSMIGFIALAGIIVRNSILLVEFAKERVQEGMSVRDSVVLAAEVRMRPIMITALALVIGSVVLLTDPIFQGMAVSLLFGSLVATFLTLVVIPLGCLSAQSQFCRIAAECGVPGRPPRGGAPAPGGVPPSGGVPPAGGLPPSGAAPAPGRPTRLAKKGDLPEGGVAAAAAAAAAAVEAAIAPESEAASGRPARLLKRTEASPVAEAAPAAEAGEAAGRPPRLVRKSEAPAPAAPVEPTGRPPRLEKRTEVPPATSAELPTPGARPARLIKRAEAPPPVVEPPEPEPTPAAEAVPEAPVLPPPPASVPAAPPPPPFVPDIAPARPVPGRPARLKKPAEAPKPAAPPVPVTPRVAEAEARERKFVARAKQAEPQAAPAAQPPAVQPPAATAATQPPAAEPSASDKLTAIQTGKKKLRGIRINPDLE
jgi:multidrug efflux pump subunit AcrB